MIRSCLALLLVLLPIAAHAAACNPDCTFIRGDANCDGSVTQADVDAIYYGIYDNADAADVNDDGAVTFADYYGLYVWLSSYGTSGYPPACPYPSAGLDCSPDQLENCCSPPSNAVAESFPASTDCLPEVVNYTWDDKQESASIGSGDGYCYNMYDVWNSTNTCWHTPTTATVQSMFTVQDEVGFTQKRLQNDVQKAMLYVLVEVWFDYEGTCNPYDCTGVNGLYVDIIQNAFAAWVTAGPKAGGPSASFPIYTFDKQLKYLYSLEGSLGNCSIASDDEYYQEWLSPPVDISDELASLPNSDCDEWAVEDILLQNMYLNWLGSTGQDVAWYEEITVRVYSWIEYEWCDECQ